MRISPPGKSRNALVHGLYAKDVLLPWDSRQDFEQLHSDLIAELSPRGRSEEEAVLDLAFLHWSKRTLWRMRQAAVLKDTFTSDIVQTGKKSWTAIRKKLRADARDRRTLSGSMSASLAKLNRQIARLQKGIEQSTDKEQVKLMEGKLDACMRILSEHAGPFLQTIVQGSDGERTFDNVYAPESLEKIVRLEAALDARIAKVLARLVGLKEFKRTPAATPGSNLARVISAGSSG
jgi:hypothetical protein